MHHFDPTQAIYVDATLGTKFSQPNLTATFKPVVAGWGPDAKSYPLQIMGDLNSAVVLFVDTPPVFGAEIRAISAFDLKDGKVARQVDYWDARLSAIADYRVPDDQYPSDFGESTIQGSPNWAIGNAANQLHAALSMGNSTAATELFTYDAVLIDQSTRTRIEGALAIGRYLQRALPALPYGIGATVRHVVGAARGGAYEWVGGPGAAARDGIIALHLDHHGKITQLTTVWDASRTSNATMKALVGLSIEQ
jgi:hypothetical protein